MPETQTLVFNYNDFCQLVSKSDKILSIIFSDLDITNVSAREQAQKLFQDKNIIVQGGATGLFIQLIHTFNRQVVLNQQPILLDLQSQLKSAVCRSCNLNLRLQSQFQLQELYSFIYTERSLGILQSEKLSLLEVMFLHFQ